MSTGDPGADQGRAFAAIMADHGFDSPVLDDEPAAAPGPWRHALDLDERVRRLRMERDARRLLDAEDDAREPRVRRTAAEYAELRQPDPIMDMVLPAGPALLGGPDSSGKSLQARDWALSVATGTPWRTYYVREARPVLWIMDEGAHDFGERWAASPLWSGGNHNVFVIAEPVNLLTGDADELIAEYADVAPGLVVFDTIYGMGMPDDMGVKEVAPVISAMKRISQSWNACTLAIGHTGHSSERRFRGSSMWRQRTDVEWHMAENRLSCERSKIANRRGLGGNYEVEFPHLRFLDGIEVVSRIAQRHMVIREDFATHPSDTTNARSKRLAEVLGVSAKTVARDIGLVQQETAE